MADRHSPAETLLHPVAVPHRAGARRPPLTTQQLRAELSDVAQASLYRHVARLVDAGLLRVTDERSVRGGIERTYAVVDSAVELGPEAFASATLDDHMRYFATFVGAVLVGVRAVSAVRRSPTPDPEPAPARSGTNRSRCG